MKKGKCSGFIDDISDEQIDALTQFKNLIQADNLVNLKDPRYDDCELLKFLRARKFKIKDVMQMFQNYLHWRKEKDVDNKIYYKFEELQQLKTVYPHGYHKTCKLVRNAYFQGRTVYIQRVGLLNLKEIFKISSEERLVDYYIREYEKLILYRYPGASRACGRKIEQSTTVLDCTHGSMKIMSSKVYQFIKLASKIGQDYYPEILGTMYIVNAPFIFSAIWAIVRGFIDEKTRKKINIMGGKFKKTLLEAIPAQNLPDFLGGTCKCEEHGGCLKKQVGPWMEEMEKLEGTAGEIHTHNPKLVPRYVGETAPILGPVGGGDGEESKQIEKDEAAEKQHGQVSVTQEEGKSGSEGTGEKEGEEDLTGSVKT